MTNHQLRIIFEQDLIFELRSQIDDLQGLINIEKSPCGRRLKQPITVEIPENLSQGEKAVRW